MQPRHDPDKLRRERPIEPSEEDEDLPESEDDEGFEDPADLKEADATGEQQHTQRRTFQVSGSPRRLDICLSEFLPDMSRAFLQRLIDEGYVSLEPSPREVKRASKVAAGAVIRVEIPPPRRMNLDPVDLPIEILYQDSNLAVVNKPSGVAVHPSLNQTDATLVNALLHHLSDLSSIGGVERPGIVHRLDKETSGVLLVAKNDLAHHALARQFKERRIHKRYLAIVRGEPSQWEGRVQLRLGKSYTNAKKQMARMDGTGKEAVTEYRVLEKYQGYALVEAFPHTGRTHQIRVHLLSERLPVACDKLYGRERRIYLSDLREQPRRLEEPPLMDRQALHAASIAFRHPVTQEEMVFAAPLHDDMHALLKALERYRALGR
jgi:23S rRNA pseudouridine1911/1915/1917 synthase